MRAHDYFAAADWARVRTRVLPSPFPPDDGGDSAPVSADVAAWFEEELAPPRTPESRFASYDFAFPSNHDAPAPGKSPVRVRSPRGLIRTR